MLALFQSSLIIASITILWRSTLSKNKSLGPNLRKTFPVFLGTALTCGLCFTYWISLFFVLIFSPLPLSFFEFNYNNNFFIHTFFSWMSIGFITLFLRFLFAYLQENLNYLLDHHIGHNH